MIPAVVLSYWAWGLGQKTFSFTLAKILCISLGLLIAALRSREVLIPRRALIGLSLAFLVSCTGVWPGLSFEGMRGDWSGGLWALTVYTCLMGFPGQTGWLKWAGALLSLHAIVQVFGYDPVWKHLPEGRRAIAWIGSPVDLGALLAMMLPGSGYLMPLIGAGLFATGSRAAWAGAVFALTPGRWKLLVLIPAILFGLYSKRPSDIGRREVWKYAIESFTKHPVVGTGPATFGPEFTRHGRTKEFFEAVGYHKTQVTAHNIILEVLSCGGILGLIGFFISLVPLLSIPALQALFLNMQFNLPHFEVLATAALLGANVRAVRYNMKWSVVGVAIVSILYTVHLIVTKVGPLYVF